MLSYLNHFLFVLGWSQIDLVIDLVISVSPSLQNVYKWRWVLSELVQLLQEIIVHLVIIYKYLRYKIPWETSWFWSCLPASYTYPSPEMIHRLGIVLSRKPTSQPLLSPLSCAKIQKMLHVFLHFTPCSIACCWMDVTWWSQRKM